MSDLSPSKKPIECLDFRLFHVEPVLEVRDRTVLRVQRLEIGKCFPIIEKDVLKSTVL